MKKNNACRFLVLLFSFIYQGHQKVYAGNVRLYVATDKEIYTPAESMQFQIFLLNAPSWNKTVYAELLDCKGTSLAKKMLPLTSGISWGNLKIPEADTSAFYILYCYVIGEDTVEADCSKRISIKQKASPESTDIGKESIIDFFTEGGTFVALMPNKLLISFKDEYENPSAGTGKIIDSKNYELTTFRIDESGYATVSFKPDFDVTYFIVIKNTTGKEIKKELPAVSKSGVNLSVIMNKDSLTYTAYSLTGDKDQLDYKLDIMADGKTVYKSDINFVLGFSVVQETISLQSLAEGFLIFRLTDTKNKLCSQRIMYNPTTNKDQVSLKIIDTVSKKSTTVSIPGYVSGYSFLNILKKNSADPANKNFKDYVEQPVIVNIPGNEVSFNDFLIAADKQPQLSNTGQAKQSPFLTLQGVAYDSDGRLLKNKKLNLIFLSKNLKKEYKVVNTDRNGNFEIGSLIFYDTVKVYYQLADNSDEKNNIRADLKVTPAAFFSGNATKHLHFACLNNAVNTTSSGTKNQNNIILEDTVTKQGKTLTGVTVKVKKEKPKSDTQKFIDENVSAQHNQASFMRNEFDFIANPQVIDNTTIFEYLRGRINLDINISARGSVKISSLSGDGIGVYLDDMDITDDLDMVTNLQIRDIALVRYYSLPLKPRIQSTKTKYSAFAGSGSGSGGDLMIYTRKGFTPTEQPVKGLPKTTVIGYDTDDPVIFSPSPFSTQSLYWKPNWVPQKEETIYIGLPAAEPDKKVQLIIEGINAAQSPFTFTKILIFK